MKRIVVVGAGTSGWMVASAIKKNCPGVDVTIVYDSKIPTVGVGETLTFFMPHFMKNVLGLSDEQWMPQVKATYKTGVSMPGWTAKDSEYQSGFCLDFPAEFLASNKFNNLAQEKNCADMDQIDHYTKGGIVDLWCSMYQNGLLGDVTGDDLIASTGEGYYFSRDRKSIRDLNGTWLVNPTVGYSYHYNADLVGQSIAELVGKPSGVSVIDSTVVSVETDGDNISLLTLKDGSTITADIFVDCSGFHRLLVKKIPFTWEPCDEYYNDSAIVGPLHYDNTDNPAHCISSNSTLAGMDNGWRFSIPLTNRSGNGYVFNSRLGHNVDQLADELSSVIGFTPPNGFRHIKWDPGHYKEMMVGNCIAFGLASGFTDPFDANNLSLTTRIVKELVDLLKANPASSNLDIANLLNFRAKFYYRDIDMRVKSCLRLSPRRDTEYYRLMADVAEKTYLKEQFIEHIVNTRKRDFNNQQKFLWKSWTHVALAVRYGIKLPDVDLSLAPLAKQYFNFNKTRCLTIANRAPTLNEYYHLN